MRSIGEFDLSTFLFIVSEADVVRYYGDCYELWVSFYVCFCLLFCLFSWFFWLFSKEIYILLLFFDLISMLGYFL